MNDLRPCAFESIKTGRKSREQVYNLSGEYPLKLKGIVVKMLKCAGKDLSHVDVLINNAVQRVG
jgi:hypothetical protein